ncbi:MAG: calcium-binding protein, partial [Blastocatellia bacterium]
DQHNLKEGDSVVIKPGVKDPDSGANIGGWQGRVSDINAGEDETLIGVLWDSVTLKKMPRSMIEYCEEEGLDWREMYIGADDVKPASARDTEEDVEDAIEEIESQTSWLFLGEEGKRIQKVLAGIDPDDTMEIFEAWEKHLGEKLKFPFEAEVSEHQSRGPFRIGARVTVKGISGVDDPYGIIVEVVKDRSSYEFPLCDLEATDQKSKNHQLLNDYSVWYSNR